ncbi:MAG TPA: response regulator transcription factor [Armatimonadota bacterium]|jgi:two-component system KDP operon response regulator KdpE
MQPLILVVDDDAQIRRAVHTILSARQYRTALAASGEEALDLAISEAPDLVVLDLGLPGIDGLEVCRQLRDWLPSPILVLSVRGTEHDKVQALDEGADDYLTKPFGAAELLARIRSLLRRSTGVPKPATSFVVGDLQVDTARRQVLRSGEEVHLTRTEFDILSYLIRNPGRVTTYTNLLEELRGPNYEVDRQTLRVHVANLRRKVEASSSSPHYILTEPGIGYRFLDAEAIASEPEA